MIAPNELKRLLQMGALTQSDLADIPSNELANLLQPASGGFVRNEDSGQTLFLNGQPNGISESPSPAMFQPPPPPQQQTMKVAGFSNGGIMQDLPSMDGPAPQIDYSRPAIDTPKGRGYYGKDGAVYVKDPQGGLTKIILGYDPEASYLASKRNFDLQKSKADIAQTEAQTAQIGAPNYQLTPEGDVFNPKTGQIETRGAQAGVLERKQKGAAYEAGVKELQKDDAAVASANALQQAYQEWAALQPKVTTGRIMGNVPAIGQPERQRLQQLENFLAINNFKPGQGNISNYERGLIKGAGPSLNNDPEANMDIIKIGLGAVQNMKDRANFREQYLQAKGNLLGAEQAWQDYLNNNPRYVRDEKTGQLGDNPNRTDWQAYFSGSAKAATPQSQKPEQSFSAMPSPASLKGRRIQAPDGTIYRSNGSSWVRE